MDFLYLEKVNIRFITICSKFQNNVTMLDIAFVEFTIVFHLFFVERKSCLLQFTLIRSHKRVRLRVFFLLSAIYVSRLLILVSVPSTCALFGKVA